MFSVKSRIQRRAKVDCRIANRRLFGSATQRFRIVVQNPKRKVQFNALFETRRLLLGFYEATITTVANRGE